MENTHQGYRLLLILLCFLGSALSVAQRVELTIPLGHDNEIVSMQLNADGVLISADRSGRLCHWDLEQGRLIKTHSMPRPLKLSQAGSGGVALGKRLDLAPSGFGRESHALEYVNVNTGEVVTCSDYKPVKKLFTTTDHQYNQFSWDAKYRLGAKGKRLEPICPEDVRPVKLGFESLGFLPNGEALYTVEKSVLKRWTYPSLNALPSVTLQDFPQSTPLSREPIFEIDSGNGFFYFLRSGRFCIWTAATSGATNPFYIWETASGQLIGQLDLPKVSQVMDVDPAGQRALIRGFLPDFERQLVYEYDLTEKRMIHQYGDATFNMTGWQGTAMLYSDDGRYIIQPRDNGDIELLGQAEGIDNVFLQTQARVITELKMGDGEDEGKGIHLSTVGNGRSTATKAGDQKIFWSWAEENWLQFTDFDWMDEPVDPQDSTMMGLQRRTSGVFQLRQPTELPTPPGSAPATTSPSPPGVGPPPANDELLPEPSVPPLAAPIAATPSPEFPATKF
ncbi:MAG: hypothetical protein AAF840_08265, partial [Bacteroidota bacterium]